MKSAYDILYFNMPCDPRQKPSDSFMGWLMPRGTEPTKASKQ